MPRPGGISWSSAVEWESGTEPDSQQGRLAWLTMRNSRDPGALRSGALAARQRRDEIVEHLLGIGLDMQITARQSLPAVSVHLPVAAPADERCRRRAGGDCRRLLSPGLSRTPARDPRRRGYGAYRRSAAVRDAQRGLRAGNRAADGSRPGRRSPTPSAQPSDNVQRYLIGLADLSRARSIGGTGRATSWRRQFGPGTSSRHRSITLRSNLTA